jgi:hypothetical protein
MYIKDISPRRALGESPSISVKDYFLDIKQKEDIETEM